MGSIKQLKGAEFVMMNSTALVAKVLSRSDVGRMNSCVSIILKHMIKHDDMFVGLDISWGAPNGALLATYTRIGCVVLDTYSKCVKHVFSNMDITVNVDVGELVADVLHQPHLRGVGLRRLAIEVLEFQFKSRSLALSSIRFYDTKQNQIECVATDAYAAYKIRKKLLGF
ncbi:hypothetical protein GOBAR_AA20348 [Gossypium barbadense]|uniref:Uncharacterized protein n=1 Tax=Gossypium barbadense TaxID=3634 RepID=A0A2P5XAH4_GOSBA|nr:hypothetical protein GOBAR_AA20348 [Gossypium barbadense]